ncbi:MAG: succinyl-diaminopimelate desuccinylase [Actinobacteria bacterium]|nr:succinyl-diaminopimelate desuccinylase [Actinomycetota bacterium]
MATDLLAQTAELVAVPSVSHDEDALCSLIEARLRGIPWLRVERVGDNVVARTELFRSRRVLLVGHTDTVPPNGNDQPKIDGDRLWGLGSADMKGGIAIMLEAATTIAEPAVDVSYVFYAREEIAAAESGLLELFETRPDLVAGDAALIGEPTGGILEAGCQGTMRMSVTLAGARAHTARPWMGTNAIHRLGRVLAELDRYEERRPVLDGCEYREALQAVSVSGGVAGNVVPDSAQLVINHRFAPDRTPAEAEAHVRDVLAPHLGAGDELDVVEVAGGAAPGLDHPLLATLRDRNQLGVRAKLGWTDVARFAEHGIPAANFGPGDSTVAHTAGEHVDRDRLGAVWAATFDLLSKGAG